MGAPLTVGFHTLGCKLNFSETSAIGRQFEKAGYQPVSFENGADIYVINTCSVTDFADKKCRNIVRRAMKINPQAKVVVVGCYAQLKPVEIAEIPGVDLVLGAAEKFRILEFIDEISNADKGLVKAGEVTQANTFNSAFSYGDRTRSFLKVQDGCNYKCTFCTIPLARGKSRSDTVEGAVKKAREIAELGVKEIVLTGVNLGDFGNGTEVIEGLKPKKEALFIDLIRELDKRVDGVERFRISSIEPNLITDEIIEFVAKSQKFVPHFHIPLQSGNNEILKEMKRRYRRELYRTKVEKIKEMMPDACIGADVIVGFPGESDEAFKESFLFIQELQVDYLHVFTYSERANTPAAVMAEGVPMEKRKERNNMLSILSEKKKRAFYERFIGQERWVLFEKSVEEGWLTGFTDNYIKIKVPSQENLVNKMALVYLEGISPTSIEMKSNLASAVKVN